MTIIIGNIIALIASVLMLLVSSSKNKKKIIIYQTIQVALLTLSSLILGGIAGAIINALTIVRNILCYNNKLTKTNIFIISISIIVLSLAFNNLGYIGLLPLISTILYTMSINTKSTIKLKSMILLNMICWGIYDVVIMSYTSAVFEFIATITSIVTISQLLKENQMQNQIPTYIELNEY